MQEPKKIMVIDDEPDIITYLMAALEDRGYLPMTVREEEAVTDAVQKEKPDLIILDIMMPRRSGISIYKDLRSQKSTRDIPVALISGLESSKGMLTDELINLIDNGAIDAPDGFIEKPVRLDDFLDLVAKLTK